MMRRSEGFHRTNGFYLKLEIQLNIDHIANAEKISAFSKKKSIPY